ncbi:MAG: hypothetical protein DRH06_07325, partial [Deltaproteobacteria bacterium]
MRLLTRLLISPWLLCPLLGLLLIGGSLIDVPTLLKLEYPIYDQLLQFRNAPDDSRVVLISSDHSSNQVLTTLINKVRQSGGKNIALLTPPGATARPSQQDLALNKLLGKKSIIVAAASNRQQILLPKNSSANPLRPTADPLPAPQQLLLKLQNPLAQYRLNHPDKWSFLTTGSKSVHPLPMGHLIFSPDLDGKIRSQILLLPGEKRLLPSLPLQLAIQTRGGNLQIIPAELAGRLQSGSLQIPVIGYYRMLFDVHTGQPPIQSDFASDLLLNKL